MHKSIDQIAREAEAVDRELRQVELIGVVQRTVNEHFDRDSDAIVAAKTCLPRAYLVAETDSGAEAVMIARFKKPSGRSEQYSVTIASLDRQGRIKGRPDDLFYMRLGEFLETDLDAANSDLSSERLRKISEVAVVGRKSKPYSNQELDQAFMEYLEK